MIVLGIVLWASAVTASAVRGAYRSGLETHDKIMSDLTAARKRAHESREIEWE